MSDILVETRDIEKRFAMPSHFLERRKPVLHALRGINFQVRRGESFCVVGESGCGKTTLGRVIMGLLEPSAGQVWYDGTRIDTLGAEARRPFRRRMQMVFQNPYASLNPRHSILRTLSEPLRILGAGLSQKAIRDKVESVMQSVGADPKWLSRMPHEFSGGQRQRISIARALMTDPEFIVADEPISALDVSIQAQVLNLLSDARKERGLTYFFITHDLSVVRHFADRVAVMYMGNVVELAPAEELFENPQHPYTKLLLSSIPRLEGGAFAQERPAGEQPDPVNPPSGCAFRTRCSQAENICGIKSPSLRPVSTTTHAACHVI